MGSKNITKWRLTIGCTLSMDLDAKLSNTCCSWVSLPPPLEKSESPLEKFASAPCWHLHHAGCWLNRVPLGSPYYYPPIIWCHVTVISRVCICLDKILDYTLYIKSTIYPDISDMSLKSPLCKKNTGRSPHFPFIQVTRKNPSNISFNHLTHVFGTHQKIWISCRQFRSQTGTILMQPLPCRTGAKRSKKRTFKKNEKGKSVKTLFVSFCQKNSCNRLLEDCQDDSCGTTLWDILWVISHHIPMIWVICLLLLPCSPPHLGASSASTSKVSSTLDRSNSSITGDGNQWSLQLWWRCTKHIQKCCFGETMGNQELLIPACLGFCASPCNQGLTCFVLGTCVAWWVSKSSTWEG